MKNPAFWMLTATIVVVLIANVFQIKLNHDNAAQSDIIAKLVQSNTDAVIATCERGNLTRQVNVRNFHKDIATFASDIAFAKAIRGAVADVPPIASALREPIANFIDKHAAAIAGKRRTIKGYIESNAPVAVRPGSVVADCSKAAGVS